MRPFPLSLESGAVRRRERESGAVVDRRQSARLLPLALAVEFFGALVAGIEASGRAQPLGRLIIERKPVGLAQDAVGDDAEPGEIDLDRLGVLFFRSFHISVIEAKNEFAMMFF